MIDRTIGHLRVHVEFVGQPAHGTQAVARRAAGGKSVGHAGIDVRHAGPAIERQQFEGHAVVVRRYRGHQQAAVASVADQVGAELGGHQCDPAGGRRIESHRLGQRQPGADARAPTWLASCMSKDV